MEKILVIHPSDSTTNFLKPIYINNIELYTLVNYNISKSKLKKLIKDHDKIIMLGHGTEYGLIGFNRFIIDSNLVYLLRDKICICIWCNADKFVTKYKLKGFYTGMIISEYDEALLYSLHDFTYSDIVSSNTLFANAVAKAINFPTAYMDENVIALYECNEYNPIIDFNIQNLYTTN